MTSETLGSTFGKVENYLSRGSVIFLHCKSKIVGVAKITSDYFHSDEEIWSDRIYPHRFKIEIKEKFQSPVSLARTKARTQLIELYGKSWAPKFLFSPQPLPQEVGLCLLEELGLLEATI